MIKLAILTCSDIDPNACNDDSLIIPYLERQNIEADFKVWDDPSINWSEFDVALVRSTWDYTEHIDKFTKFIKTLPESVRVFNSRDIILNNFDKSYLFELESKGLQIVPSMKSLISKDIIQKSFDKFRCSKIVIKPLIGAGASGIVIVDKNQTIAEQDFNEKMLIQPFQESITNKGETSLIFFNGEFSHAILKVPKENDFRSQEEFGSQITSFSPDEKTIKYAKSALNEISDDTLYARVDLLMNEENEWRLIGEVELIEPALYLSYNEESTILFSDAIINRIKN